jgi:hypothetical protein
VKRHTAEEVITKLRQAEADLAQGLSVCVRRIAFLTVAVV